MTDLDRRRLHFRHFFRSNVDQNGILLHPLFDSASRRKVATCPPSAPFVPPVLRVPLLPVGGKV